MVFDLNWLLCLVTTLAKTDLVGSGNSTLQCIQSIALRWPGHVLCVTTARFPFFPRSLKMPLGAYQMMRLRRMTKGAGGTRYSGCLTFPWFISRWFMKLLTLYDDSRGDTFRSKVGWIFFANSGIWLQIYSWSFISVNPTVIPPLLGNVHITQGHSFDHHWALDYVV